MTERAQNGDFRSKPLRFTPSPGNSSICRTQQEIAENRRFLQKTDDFRRALMILAEHRRKPQILEIGVHHLNLRCITFGSALFKNFEANPHQKRQNIKGIDLPELGTKKAEECQRGGPLFLTF